MTIRHGLLLLVLASLVPHALVGTTLALLPMQDRTGDQQAALALRAVLEAEIEAAGASLVDPQVLRGILRRNRLRSSELMPPETLRRLGQDLEADWLVSATLHEAAREAVPRLTVSVRSYSSATGKLVWSRVASGAGVDRRKVLGLGEIRDLQTLTAWLMTPTVEELVSALRAGEPTTSRDTAAAAAQLGAVAIVPFEGRTAGRATANAELVTEIVRAVALRHGLNIISPNRVSAVLREAGVQRWGGAEENARRALRKGCGAATILTGAVEQFHLKRGPVGPEPHVSLAMRLLNAETGRIEWIGASERDVARKPGAFGRRRVYSAGALADRLAQKLIRELLSEVPSR